MKFKLDIVSVLIGMMIAVLAIVAGYRKGLEQRPVEKQFSLGEVTELPVSQWKVVEMEVTAYCACEKCCGAFSDGFTANMYKIKPNDKFLAAPENYSFGTEMIVPGYNNGEAVIVRDRGGAIKGNNLDVFFSTHDAALQWGRQKNLKVLVKK